MCERRSHSVLAGAAVFLSGGFAYGLIEVSARGYTHISMGLLGGAAMLLIHKMNGRERTLVKLMLRSLFSALFITACELVTGELLNIRMGLNIWDYSHLPMNYDGQICLFFSCIWFALSAIGSVLDDLLRYFILHENRSFVLFRKTVLCTADTDIPHIN